MTGAQRSRNAEHLVQFYKADEACLNRNAARFLWEGLLRGDGLLVVAPLHRRESLSSQLTRLGADVALAQHEQQLVMLDAAETLSQLMVDGLPGWDRFEVAATGMLKLAKPRAADGEVCAYGEMAGTLWEAGQTLEAIQLEEYWNRLVNRGGLSLFCGYPIDIFAREFAGSHTHAVAYAHTHVLPTDAGLDLAAALDRAIQDLLGSRADQIRSAMKAAASSSSLPAPEAERAILWLRHNVPENADEILACARTYYAASRASAGSS